MANGFGFNPMFAGQMGCPSCGYGSTMMGGPMGMGYPSGGGYPYFAGMGYPFGMGPSFPYGFQPGFQPSYGPWFGGPMTWGGTYPGMYGGPRMYGGPATYGGGWAYTENWPSDEQIGEMIYDSIDADPVIPYDSDINVDVTGGVVTLSGTVPNKRIKHAVGDDAWWVPGVWDVSNNLQIVGRRERAAAPAAGKAETTMPKTTTRK